VLQTSLSNEGETRLRLLLERPEGLGQPSDQLGGGREGAIA